MGPAVTRKREGTFTYQDYCSWSEGERWELINGEAYDMTPAPTTKHQRIVVNLCGVLNEKLRSGPCKVFVAPTDVVLSDYDVVQPDVFVVCDKKKITPDNIQGAPDLVIEVLSPSTSLKDKRDKKSLYERSGVKEYLIVSPEELFVERYLLKEGKFTEPDIVGAHESLSLISLEHIDIPLREVFEVGPTKEPDEPESHTTA